jgi:transcriptional regulator with XRE-family HTH domain
MVRNECFRLALDYLYKNGLVADQRELSEKTGLSQKSISQILNNRVQKPSEASIRKLNEAFGNIFNPEYFRGHSIHLLMEDVTYYAQHPDKDPSSRQYVPIDERMEASEPAQDYQPIPKWADSIIQLLSSQVQTIEDLRREVASLRQEIIKLKS